jgi:type III secretion system YscD/HrpQ family protein
MHGKLVVEKSANSSIVGQEFSLEEGGRLTLVGRLHPNEDANEILLAEDLQVEEQIHLFIDNQQLFVEVEALNEPLMVEDQAVETLVSLKDRDCISFRQLMIQWIKQEIDEPIAEENKETELSSTATASTAMTSDEITRSPEIEKREPMPVASPDTILIMDSNSPDYMDLEIEVRPEWLLKVLTGPLQGAEFALEKGKRYVIGNDPLQAKILLHDRAVSRAHAQVQLEERHLLLKDLKSTNGTWRHATANGIEHLDAVEGEVKLISGESFQVGTTVILFYNCMESNKTILAPVIQPKSQNQNQKEESLPTAKEENKEVSSLPVENLQEKKLEEEKAPIDKVNTDVVQGETFKDDKFIAEIEDDQTQSKLDSRERNKSSVDDPGTKGGKFFFLMIVGAFVFGGGLLYLHSDPKVVEEIVPLKTRINSILLKYPSVQADLSGNPVDVILTGHLLTAIEEVNLLRDLRELPELAGRVQSNIIIDAAIAKETQEVLKQSANWKEITIIAQKPSSFSVIGKVKSKEQLTQFMSYLEDNFLFMDLIDNQILVEDEVIEQVMARLNENALTDVFPSIQERDLLLSGSIRPVQRATYDQILQECRSIPGVKAVKSSVSEDASSAPGSGLIDLSSRYRVTGSFAAPNSGISVIVNGRIYGAGDMLEDYLIISIEQGMMILELENTRYKIIFKG